MTTRYVAPKTKTQKPSPKPPPKPTTHKSSGPKFDQHLSKPPTATKKTPPKKTKKSTKTVPPVATGTVYLYRQYPLTNEWGYSDNIAARPIAPASSGYDVQATRMVASRRLQAKAAANMILTDGVDPASSFQFSSFVHDISIDTSLSGSNAQAQLVRDFYPRNFVQPTITIMGQSLDQEDYGLLCEFIHNCQIKAVQNGSTNLTQVMIMGKAAGGGTSGNRGFNGTRSSGNRVVLSQPALMINRPSDPNGGPAGVYYNQTVRGSHQPLLAKGYVATMPRIHSQFENAPIWTMQFVVAAMLSGPYRDSLQDTPRAQKTWVDMLADIKSGAVTVSDAENKAALLAAKNNTGTVFPAVAPSSGNSSTGPGGGSGTGTGGTGSVWAVKYSLEDASSGNGWTELSSNGNGAGAAGGTQSGNCTGGSVGGCDFATLGQAFPHGTQLIIMNPSTGQKGTFPLTDVGNGSGFGPAIGLTPAVQGAIGASNSGGTVHIQLPSGNLSVKAGFGKLV